MLRRWRRGPVVVGVIIIAAVIGLVVASASYGRAQTLPYADTELRVDGGTLTVARSATPAERIGRLAARRLSARRRAEQRAREALHRWVDDALAQVRAWPVVATAVHGVVAGAGVQVQARPLVDGSAVAVLRLELTKLRAVTGELRGLPW